MVGGIGHRLKIRILRLLRAALALAISASLYAAWRNRPAPFVSKERSPTLEHPLEPVTAPQRGLESYAALWQRDLKQPPVEPPSSPARVSLPSRQLPELIATCVNGKRCWAHLRDETGTVHMRGISESIDDFTVAAIESGRVMLISGEHKSWIEVPEDEEH